MGVIAPAWYGKVTQNISWQSIVPYFLRVEKKRVWVSHGIDLVETVMFMSTRSSLRGLAELLETWSILLIKLKYKY